MLSSLAVLRRDVQYATQVVMPLLLFVTPVAYSVASVPASIRAIYLLQPHGDHRGGLPMVIGRATLTWLYLSTLACGVRHRDNAPFTVRRIGRVRRLERKFADVV